MEVLSFILSLSSATSKTQTYFQHINVFMMLLTIIITMVMIRNITAVMIITKYSLPTVDFATRYSTRYSDFLLQPYSNPTRSKKRLLVGACCFLVLISLGYILFLQLCVMHPSADRQCYTIYIVHCVDLFSAP